MGMADESKKVSGAFAPRESKQSVEEALGFAPKFGPDGLIPAMALDADTGTPLMMAYMNEETLRMTLALGQAVYWSRSRNEVWHKGKTSGEFQDVVELLTDCDQDALVLRVHQRGGGCCHTERKTCFYRRVQMGEGEDAPLRLEWV
jgi:phosphoribosyl-AMP cyclohydrolase